MTILSTFRTRRESACPHDHCRSGVERNLAFIQLNVMALIAVNGRDDPACKTMHSETAASLDRGNGIDDGFGPGMYMRHRQKYQTAPSGRLGISHYCRDPTPFPSSGIPHSIDWPMGKKHRYRLQQKDSVGFGIACGAKRLFSSSTIAA